MFFVNSANRNTTEIHVSKALLCSIKIDILHNNIPINFNFAQQINADLERFAFDKAIYIAEAELKKLPTTPFHDVINKSLIAHANDLTIWVEDFYRAASKEVDIKALYFEMNEFDINTDLWYIDCFTYSNDGGLNPNDMDWLSDFDTNCQSITGTVFTIQGYEKLQNAFDIIEPDTETLQNARDWCEQIIIARFMELIRTSHLTAKKHNLAWAKVPTYFTEHAYDFIVKSEAE